MKHEKLNIKHCLIYGFEYSRIMVDIVKSSEDFAVRTYKLYKYLIKEKKEFILSKQFLRSGTSIGANANEAQGAVSTNDFIAKMHIALKEARESKYWLRIFLRTELLNETQFNSIYDDACKLEATLVKILKSSKGDGEV